MKLKKNFAVYNLDDDYMLIPTGKEIGAFGGTVVLNEVAAFLVEQIKEEHKTLDQLVSAILSEYDVDEKTARADVEEAVNALKQSGVIEE